MPENGRTESGVPVGVVVQRVLCGSAAEHAGIRPGDRVLSVSGSPVEDLLDLHFLTAKRRFSLRWRDAQGREENRMFRPGDAPLGIVPEPVRARRCRNRCIFCFVHQLPKGLRRSLYVKDEDVRLSFLHGQYVTFSDVTEEEIRKIVRYRLTPLYVSIHTTDPALRRRMLGNPRAADLLPVLRRLVRAGIELHGQIVVCPGVNDGAELERTLAELAGLRPGLRTVAVVPVGLTSHREGLPVLRSVSREEAVSTLDLLGDASKPWSRRRGEEPFAVAADEYYLLSGRRIPGRASYGSFAQIENGVGLIRRFLDDARTLFRKKPWPRVAGGGTVPTGRSAYGIVSEFLDEFSSLAGASFRAVPVPNRLMGEGVTVTGLLGGEDIAAAVGTEARAPLFLPDVALRDGGDRFLDGLTPSDLSRRIGVPVLPFVSTPHGFFETVYSRNPSIKR